METTKKIYRDIPNRTSEQLQDEYNFLKGYLSFVTDPGFERFMQIESELYKRGLLTPAAFSV